MTPVASASLTTNVIPAKAGTQATGPHRLGRNKPLSLAAPSGSRSFRVAMAMTRRIQGGFPALDPHRVPATAMTVASDIVLALLCLIPLGTVVAYFVWLWRSFGGLGERSIGPTMPMTTGGYITWTLLSLALSAVAVFICWAAVDLLQQIERNRARGVDQFFIDEERSHALSAGFVGVLFGSVPFLRGVCRCALGAACASDKTWNHNGAIALSRLS
jgi:hypothetical protein